MSTKLITFKPVSNVQISVEEMQIRAFLIRQYLICIPAFQQHIRKLIIPKLFAIPNVGPNQSTV